MSTTLPARLGLADRPPAELGGQVLAAWDGFLDIVSDPATDLTRPSRLPGWTGKDTCIHLATWPEAQVLEGVLASAREGGEGAAPDQDEANAALVHARREAPVDDVVAALHASRDRIARFFASGEADALGRLPSRSAVGPLPVLSLVHAGCYELAVHALDLAPCGAPPPPPQLLQRGLAALVDVTGALAARAGVELVLTAATPEGGWRFDSGADGWATEAVGAGRFEGTGVTGAAADLLDVSAGRGHPAQLLLTRRIHVQELHSWMRLAPLLEQVPGLPGGPALKAALAGLHGVGAGLHGVGAGLQGVAAGAGKVLSRLPGRRR